MCWSKRGRVTTSNKLWLKIINFKLREAFGNHSQSLVPEWHNWNTCSSVGSQNKEKVWGLQREKTIGQRKSQKCIQLLSFANPLFISLGVKSGKFPLQNRQLRGWEGILNLLVTYLLKHNELRPPPLTLSFFSAPQHPLFSVWKNNRPSLYPLQLSREGRQMDLMENEKQKSPSSFFVCDGSKARHPPKEPNGLVNRTTRLCSSA